MRTREAQVPVAAAVVITALILLGSQPLQAQQSTSQIGIGYVGNAATQMLGAGAHFVVPALGGIGLFVDAKTAASWPSSGPRFRSDLTASEVKANFPDRESRTEDRWRTVNAGLVRPLTPELAIYAGAGYSHRTAYVEFEDPTLERSENGLYWVEDPTLSDATANVMAGAFFRLGSHFLVQFGFETAPRGMTVGGRYVFSF